MNPATAKHIAAFGTGVLFAIGLGVSRMTHPAKIQGFLDIAGDWDPSLAFVMIGAIPVTFALYRLAGRRARPLLAASYPPPAAQGLDARLFAGSAIFGAGWGLGGFCPGPAVVALASFQPGVFALVAGMVGGALAYRFAGAKPLDEAGRAATVDGC